MINKELFGKVIYYYGGKEAQILKGGISKRLGECYLINEYYPTPPEEHGYGLGIISIERMDEILSNQEKFKEVYESNKRFWEEQERKERKAAEEKAKREDLFGFDKDKTPCQKGKILKTLMKKYRYFDYKPQGKEFIRCNQRVLTRRDYIIEQLKKGSYIDKEVIQGKTTYRLNHAKEEGIPDGYTLITKTEYDFANYLINMDVLKTI